MKKRSERECSYVKTQLCLKNKCQDMALSTETWYSLNFMQIGTLYY